MVDLCHRHFDFSLEQQPKKKHRAFQDVVHVVRFVCRFSRPPSRGIRSTGEFYPPGSKPFLTASQDAF